MDLNEFSRQLESMHARFMQLWPTDGLDRGDLRSMWEETSEALGVTMEEMRVAEEELRQQNEELEESRQEVEAERQRYQDLFDFAPDGYLVTDLSGMIREANRAAGELLGSRRGTWRASRWRPYLAMDDRAAFRGGLTRPAAGRPARGLDRPDPAAPRLGHSTRPITAAVVRDWDGTPSSLRWMFREVAGGIGGECRRGSRANGRVTIGLADDSGAGELEGERPGRLRAEDEAEAAPRAAGRHRRDRLGGRRARPAATGSSAPGSSSVLGYPAENWLAEPGFWAEIVHADDRSLAESHRARCLREGRAGELEYRVAAADGRAVWFRESLPIEPDAGAGRGAPRLPLGHQPPQEGRAAAPHRPEQAGRAPGRRLALVPPAAATCCRRWNCADPRGDPHGGDRVPGGRAGAGPPARSRPRRAGDRRQPGPAGGLPRSVRPGAGRRRGLRAGRRRGRAGDRRGHRVGPVAAAGWAEAARWAATGPVSACPLVSRDGELVGDRRHLLPRSPPPVGSAAPAGRAICPPGRRRDRRASGSTWPFATSDRRKEEFLAMLAHELRNPLAAIQTCGQLLRPDALDAVILGEVRDVIVRQTRYMSRLVEDLLDATRISRGTIALRKEPVDLAEVVGPRRGGRPAVDRGPRASTGRLAAGRARAAWRPTRPGWSRSCRTC